MKAGEKGESKKRKKKIHYSLLFNEFEESCFLFRVKAKRKERERRVKAKIQKSVYSINYQYLI